MKNIIQALVLIFTTITGTVVAQSVTSVPGNIANNRFLTEYHSVIRPGLSLNGFDNTGTTSRGLGLKQVLNAALTGDVYIKAKLNKIFEDAAIPLITSNPSDNEIETNSRILQYTAFEALASYVLEHNGIDSVDSKNAGLNIRSHAVAVADLRQK